MNSFRRLALRGFALACAIFAATQCGCGGSQGNSNPPPPRTLSSIAVTPPTPSVAKNSTQQFTATGTFNDGSMQNITTTAQWASSDTTVATIAQNTGLATGVGPGQTQITASQNGVVSPAANLTVTGAGAVPALVQHVSSSNTRMNGFTSPFCYHFQLPNPTTAGNAVVVGFTFNGNPTPTVSDDKNNSYMIEAKQFDSTDSQSIAIAAAFKVAAGARVIDVCFSADPGGFVQPMATEFSNVTGIDSAGTGNDGSGTAVTAGNLAPATSGDLVYQVVSSISVNQSSFTAGAQANISWNLLSADLMDGFAAQFGVYNSAAAINPTMSMGTSQKWVSAAVLLKSGSSGSVPSGMRIVHLIHENIPFRTAAGGTGNPFPNPLALQLPSAGNLLVAMIGGGNSSQVVTSMSDTNNNLWTTPAPAQVKAGNDTVQAFYAANANPSANLRLTLQWDGSSGDFTILFYDVRGAAASPFDTVSGSTGTQNSLGNFMAPFSIFPATASEIIFVQTVWDFNTGIGLLDTSQFFDGNTFDGESLDGPEPVDENNGWGHVLTTSTAQVHFTWIPKDATQNPFGNWAGMAVAFKAGP